jgi:hypothetical protein
VIDMPAAEAVRSSSAEAVRSSEDPLPSERVASGSTYTGNAGGLDRDPS